MRYFKIAGLTLSINNKGIALQKELDDFEITDIDDNRCDIDIDFDTTGNDLGFLQSVDYTGKLVNQNYLVKIYEEPLCYYVVYFSSAMVYGFQVFKNERKAIIYLEDIHYEVYDTRNVVLTEDPDAQKTAGEFLLYAIRDCFFFQALALGRVAIHSSSIVYRDRAWLFSAASGVGKSTHTNLWLDHISDVKSFNGDVAICYEQDSLIYAASLPWSGTSYIYSNSTVPLGGIFFLKRDATDHVESMNPLKSALELSARCVTPAWTPELFNENLKQAQSIAGKVLTKYLYCTPTPNAVTASKQAIDAYLN